MGKPQKENAVYTPWNSKNAIKVKNASTPQMGKFIIESIDSKNLRRKKNTSITTVITRKALPEKHIEVRVEGSPKVVAAVPRFNGSNKRQRLIKGTIKNAEKLMANELKDW